MLPQLEEIQKKSSADTLAGNKGKQLIHKVRFAWQAERAVELQLTWLLAYRPSMTNWYRS